MGVIVDEPGGYTQRSGLGPDATGPALPDPAGVWRRQTSLKKAWTAPTTSEARESLGLATQRTPTPRGARGSWSYPKRENACVRPKERKISGGTRAQLACVRARPSASDGHIGPYPRVAGKTRLTST